jgi:exosortase B
VRAVLDAGSRCSVALEWLPVLAGLLLLYVPTFYDLAHTVWQVDEPQGPLILAIIAWVTWRERRVLLDAHTRAAPVAGIALLVPGLLLYVLGRSQEIPVVEVGALAPILAGVLLAMRGWPAVRVLWFPLLFVVFLVPLPPSFVDTLTGPLKQQVSASAEYLLHAARYPVARSGVVLEIGQYQLLVADACSGLNSMISLSALGLLYLYLVRHRSWLHNAIVAASILPIAFSANVVRVAILSLVTYHFGDAAGQGFLHGAAGLVLVMAALLLILGLDAGLTRVVRTRRAA